MSAEHGEATARDGGDVNGGAAASVPPTSDTTGEATPPIICRYGRLGAAAACGAFDAEHHTRASTAGVCCADLAFRDVAGDQADEPTSPAGEWPPFDPSDDDVPGGDW